MSVEITVLPLPAVPIMLVKYLVDMPRLTVGIGCLLVNGLSWLNMFLAMFDMSGTHYSFCVG